MTSDTVLYDSSDFIATITLNRPDKLNALSHQLGDALRQAWLDFEASDDRVAVLTGSGRAFTAGADLDGGGDMWSITPGVGVKLTKPVIAAVNGLTVGGGLCLVQMADMAVAAESAWISYPEAKIGFTGGIIASLVSRMPHKAAMELLMTGEKMSAQRAYELGFFNKVVPDADLMSETRSLAQKVAANAPLVIAALKQLADEVMPRGPMEGAGWARRMVEATFASNDLQEGLASFRERRTPTFKGD
ncbi:MAG: enoyl-CoA hydratase/isomerase family protein [Alphaproteobacteria bacterium]|nr:enoyl-CoA hydratase/isomerase family protein [Alphaproteobacteria bacterium]